MINTTNLSTIKAAAIDGLEQTSDNGQSTPFVNFRDAFRTFSNVKDDVDEECRLNLFQTISLVQEAYETGGLFIMAITDKGETLIGARLQGDVVDNIARLAGMSFVHMKSLPENEREKLDAFTCAIQLALCQEQQLEEVGYE